MTDLPRLFLVADAARWGSERCVALVERLVGEAPPGELAVWDREPDGAEVAGTVQARLHRLDRLRRLTADHDQRLIVGARVDLAVTSCADGVQLPERGLDVATVRSWFPTMAIGRSCHDRQGLERAEREGATWATLSPVAPTRSKTAAVAPLGMDGFEREVSGLSMPVWALGGVNAHIARDCTRAGARGVAVSAALFESRHPAETIRAILKAL